VHHLLQGLILLQVSSHDNGEGLGSFDGRCPCRLKKVDSYEGKSCAAGGGIRVLGGECFQSIYITILGLRTPMTFWAKI